MCKTIREIHSSKQFDSIELSNVLPSMRANYHNNFHEFNENEFIPHTDSALYSDQDQLNSGK